MAVGVTQVPVRVIAEDAFSAAGKRIIGYFWGDFWQEAIRVQFWNILHTIGNFIGMLGCNICRLSSIGSRLLQNGYLLWSKIFKSKIYIR